ncbi:MAG: non-ribosomal peptide synthetase, partial [Pseudomonadota bacterium]
SVYSRDTAEQYGCYFVSIVRSLIADATRTHASTCLVSEEEAHTLVVTRNRSERQWPTNDGVLALFEKCVTRRPEAPAVSDRHGVMSYADLDAAANRLANRLIDQGVQTNDVVGVCVRRSVDAIVSILAVMKAGATYLPLDIELPEQRVMDLVTRAGAVRVITNAEPSAVMREAGTPVTHLNAPEEVSALARSSARCQHLRGTAEDTAYIMFTSGSTGQPKAVVIRHDGLTNLAQAQCEAFEITHTSCVLQYASYAFDASVSEWSTALVSGAHLFIVDEETRRSPTLLGEAVRAAKVTHATLPPAMLPILNPEDFASVTHLVTAGESCAPATAKQWSAGRRYFNAYGPTEGTVCATIGGLDATTETLHIGTPMANVQCYVLDQNQQLAPDGVIGELYIAGRGLAKGYLNAPELTLEKFSSIDVGGERIRAYRTGDLVRWLSSGNLEFIGRADGQVKINAQRVEPAEVEKQLVALDEVSDAIVVATSLEDDDASILFAYVVSENAPDDDARAQRALEIRSRLALALPLYMIPTGFLWMNRLPLTLNGKVDRQALPRPTQGDLCLQKTRAPSSEAEIKVHRQWTAVLGHEDIGAEDNFYLLGGDSLAAMRLLSKINEAFDVNVSLAEL